MRHDHSAEGPLDPTAVSPKPGERSAERARTLFAKDNRELQGWTVVAQQLDPAVQAPDAPDFRTSYGRLLAQIPDTELGSLGAESQPSNTTSISQQGRERILDRRREQEGATTPGAAFDSNSKRISRISRNWRTYAAGGALIAANAIAFLLITNRTQDTSSGTPDVVYSTRNGEQTAITLRDGTKVRLNVGSRLHVPMSYATDTRSVFLEGEAEFTVQHNAAKPFVVHAGTTVVRDLATRFIVRAYRDVARTTVAVAEGRVEVNTSTLQQPSSAIVGIGQIATVSLDRGVLVQSHAALESEFSWTKGTLSFNEVPVSEALAQFARWYDVECEVSDAALLRTELTFSFTEKTLTDRQLNDLGDVLGARVVRNGRLITFTPRG